MSCSDGNKSQDGQTVVIGMKGDFDSFNELNASDSDALQVINNMLFMTLTKLDENLKIVPYLAKSWEFSEQDKILTYYLHKNVYWTDGTATTASDVLFTYQIATHADVAYPAASRFDMTERVEVIDSLTVRFHFKKPYPDGLFDTQIPILPKHILGKMQPKDISQSDFNRNPVGNGPFKLIEWKANQHVIFEYNPDFVFGRALLDKVIFSIIPDESVLLTNLQTGSIDVIPYLSTQDFQKIQSENKFQGLKYGGRGYTFLAWNCARKILSKEIRRALSHAIDKDEIIATLMDGLATPAKGPLLPFVWAFDKNLEDIKYDPALAQSLLNQNGWKDSNNDGILDRDGEKLALSIKTNSGSQMRKDIAVMVQAQLKAIGVDAKVDIVEFNLMLDQVFGNKDFDVLLSGWDADFTVNPTDLFHSDAITNGYNFVSYKNPRIDFLLEKGRQTAKQEQAQPYWSEFQKIILEDCPYSFLFIQDKLAGYNKKLSGIEMDVRGFLCNIHEWSISQ
ncbi:MAG: peptide-binding protein [bacterium]|nr:peptide-binding protein [bacterium]